MIPLVRTMVSSTKRAVCSRFSSSRQHQFIQGIARTRLRTSQFHSDPGQPKFPLVQKAVDLMTSFQSKPSEELNQIKETLRKGDMNKVRELVSQIPAVYLKDPLGRNLFHYAAIQGNAELIQALVEKNHPGLDDFDKQGLTPLHWAIHEGHPKVVEVLIESGAHINQPWTSPDGRKLNPMAMAVAAGNRDILEVFLKKDVFRLFDLKEDIKGVGSLLHLAIQSNQAPMLEYLLQHQHQETKDLLERKDEAGRTPLQLAAYLGDLYSIRLLHQQGVDLNRGRDQASGTAVHCAALGQQPQAIQLLDFLGADLLALDDQQKVPLNYLKKDESSWNSLQCKELLQRLPRIDRSQKTAPPDFKKRPPYNLIFQGGGPKGVAYAGALKEMEQKGLLTQLQRTAGTSAGSIIAALVSLGYSPDEIEKVMFDLDFGVLLDTKGQLEKALLESAKDRDLKQGLKAVLAEYWEGFKQNPFHPITTAENLIQKLYSMTGFCDGEELRKQIEDLVFRKTGIQYCTVKEFHEKFVRKQPGKFKDLHVFSTRLHKFKNSEIIRFSYEDPRWHDLVWSDGICASASIPGVFLPRNLHFKDVSNQRHPRPHYGQFVDGGLLKNFPLDAFDDNKYQEDKYFHGKKTNRRTIGFALGNTKAPTPEEIQEIDSAFQLARVLSLTYFHAQEIIMHEQESGGRAITIPIPEGIGMLSFKLTDDQKASMIKSGAGAVDFFFNPSRQ